MAEARTVNNKGESLAELEKQRQAELEQQRHEQEKAAEPAGGATELDH